MPGRSPDWWTNPTAEIEFVRVQHDPFLKARNLLFSSTSINPDRILDIKLPDGFNEQMTQMLKGFKNMGHKISSDYSTKEQLALVEESISTLEKATAEIMTKNDKKMVELCQQAEDLRAKLKDEERLNEMECTVSLLPVCSCGHVFDNLEIQLPKTTRIYGDSDHEIPDVGSPKFNIIFCPSCNKKLASYVNRMSFDRCDGTITTRQK